MRLYVLDLGYQICDELLMYQNVSIGTTSNSNPTNRRIKWGASAILIEHPDKGWIIYDTGVHPDAMNGHLSEALQDFSPYFHTDDQTIVNQLAKIGLKPEDIKTVVLSHSHFDHTGGLHLFTDAELYWAKDDFDAAMEKLYMFPANPEYVAFVRKDIWDLKVKKVNFIAPDDEFELAEGIDLIHLPGHAADILGMVVHLDGQTMIFTSDAVYSAENYGDPDKGIAPVVSGSIQDSVAAARSVEKVRRFQKKYNAKVIFGHDYDQLQTLKKIPEYYS